MLSRVNSTRSAPSPRVLPGRRAPEQRLIGRLGRTDILDQSDDVIEAGDHDSPF